MDFTPVKGPQLSTPSSILNTQSASDRAKFNQEDFLKMLTAELTNQDPLEPLSNHEFLGQLASLQSLESTAALTDGIESLRKFQQMASASNMIGKFIRGVTAEGETVTGMVERVILDPKQGIQLMVGGHSLPIDAIRELRAEEGSDPVDRFLDKQEDA